MYWRARILFAALLLGIPVCARAQMRFDAAGPAGRSAREAFDRAYTDKTKERLDCQVSTYPARLSYDLQISASYEFLLPLRQFQGKEPRTLLNVFRVTPRKPQGEPVWFIRRWPVRRIPAEMFVDKRLALQLGGGFLVGPGDYQVDWLLIDGEDRVCRKSWRVKARESRAESLGIKPGFIDDDRRLMNWRGPAAANETARSATIFLHAAPTFRRRYSTRLSWWDYRLLMTSLTNTIDRGGFSAARVIVLDLQRRRVLFEASEFTGREYRRMGEVLGEVDLATIDYATLAKGPSEWAFLENLLADERKRPDQPDAYIYISPAWREGERRRPLSEGLLEGLPRVFALALAPFGRYTSGTVLDFVKAARGRAFNIFQPPDLATATERLRRELDEASR